MQVDLNFKDIQLLLLGIDSLIHFLDVSLNNTEFYCVSDDDISDIINDKLVLQSLRSKLKDVINR